MSEKLFYELQHLIKKRNDYQSFLEDLKSQPFYNKIELASGRSSIRIDEDLMIVLIYYYEEKIKELNVTIRNFRLFKVKEKKSSTNI